MVDQANTVDASAIRKRLEDVRERIEQACQRAGRRSSEVTLVGVSKTFPLAAVEAAYEAGLRDFGENRVQELEKKSAGLPGIYNEGDVRWHLVGHLQRNKVKKAIQHFDLFHALDSPRLARELDKRAARIDRVIPALVQVNVSGEASKYGMDPEKVPDYLDGLAQYEHLKVVGLMTIPALVENAEKVRPGFSLLRKLFDEYADQAVPNVDLQFLSMGMTNDFEVAIEEGATHIRVGRGIFGARNY